jgi:predicted acylesterase/phospholipase RssA
MILSASCQGALPFAVKSVMVMVKIGLSRCDDMALDINPLKKKLILTIDGGGTRGIIPVAMLVELEKMTGIKCYDLFDMVGGTSTGAIIAAGIALRLSAQELLDLVYKGALLKPFRQQGRFRYIRYVLNGLRYIYDLKPFIKELGKYAGSTRIGALEKPFVFMTTRDVRAANTYYIVSKGPGRQMFADWPVIGAVAASGAAPIYFPPVLGNLIDGGVGTNANPCFSATIEALEYIGKHRDATLDERAFRDGNVIHLSLGTGYAPRNRQEGEAGRFWLYHWVRYIIDETLTDTSLQQVFNTLAVYRQRIDFRRYNPYMETTSVRDILGVAIKPGLSPEVVGNKMDAFAPDEIDLMEAIGRQYALTNPAKWTTEGYLPWITDEPQSPNDSPRGSARDGGHPLPGIAGVSWEGSEYTQP